MSLALVVYQIKSYLRKLQHYPITLEILQETGVGKTVNGLRKYGGAIGDKAKLLVNNWKTLVVVEEDDGPEHAEDEPGSPGRYRAESPGQYRILRLYESVVKRSR
jgi:transcription elongation factor B polypeptide 3